MSKPVFNVRDYGSVNGGNINEALGKAARAAEAAGGGIVRIPAGTWRLSVDLPPDVDLEFEPGADSTEGGSAK